MAAKPLYMTNDSAVAGFTAPSTSGYGAVGSTTVNNLAATPSTSGAATSQAAETLTTQPVDLLARRFVTTDQFLSAGDFGGAWTAVIGVNENNSLADIYFRMRIRVFNADGSVERGSGYTFLDTVEMGTTLTGIAYSGTIPTISGCQVGDRVLVEVGGRSINTSATSYQVNVRRGGTSATPMVAGDTGTNVNARNSWLQFSDGSDAANRFAEATAGGRMLLSAV